MWAREAFDWVRSRLPDLLAAHGEHGVSGALEQLKIEWDVDHRDTEPPPAPVAED
jgi:hypothetical protein